MNHEMPGSGATKAATLLLIVESSYGINLIDQRHKYRIHMWRQSLKEVVLA